MGDLSLYFLTLYFPGSDGVLMRPTHVILRLMRLNFQSVISPEIVCLQWR